MEELEGMEAIDEPLGMNYTEGGRIYQKPWRASYDDEEERNYTLKGDYTKRVPYGYLELAGKCGFQKMSKFLLKCWEQ